VEELQEVAGEREVWGCLLSLVTWFRITGNKWMDENTNKAKASVLPQWLMKDAISAELFKFLHLLGLKTMFPSATSTTSPLTPFELSITYSYTKKQLSHYSFKAGSV